MKREKNETSISQKEEEKSKTMSVDWKTWFTCDTYIFRVKNYSGDDDPMNGII